MLSGIEGTFDGAIVSGRQVEWSYGAVIFIDMVGVVTGPTALNSKRNKYTDSRRNKMWQTREYQ